MMTFDEAREFRRGHDSAAAAYTRKTRAQLAVIDAGDMARLGQTRLIGKLSKDELISVILERRWPHDRLNESIHVLAHLGRPAWDGCEWCRYSEYRARLIVAGAAGVKTGMMEAEIVILADGDDQAAAELDRIADTLSAYIGAPAQIQVDDAEWYG